MMARHCFFLSAVVFCLSASPSLGSQSDTGEAQTLSNGDEYGISELQSRITGGQSYSEKVKKAKKPIHPACCLDPNRVPINDLDTLFFVAGVCPVDTFAETICEIASIYYATKGTRLVHIGSHDRGHYGDKATSQVAILNTKHNEKYFKVLKKADLVVIQDGGCFNVASNVHAGDHLTANCFNPIVGDQRRFTEVMTYHSLVLGGTLSWTAADESSPVESEGSAIVGGDLVITPAADINTVGKVGGLFPSSPLVVSGNVSGSPRPGPQPIQAAVISSSAQYLTLLGGRDYDARLVDGYKVFSEEAIERLRVEVSTFVCAFSKSLQASPPAGTVDVRIDPLNALDVRIYCLALKECIVTLPEPPLTSANAETTLHVISLTGDVRVVKINWPGKVVIINIVLESTPTYSIIWNFFEAEEVYLRMVESDSDWHGTIIAPRASIVKFNSGGDSQVVFFGSILMGRSDSTLQLDDVERIALSPAPCPPLPPIISLCTCLCGDDENVRDEKKQLPPAER